MGGRRGGTQVLEPAAIGGADHHFSDVVSAAVLSHVTRTTGVPAEQVLRRAGDRRAVGDVASGASWSSHTQFRALLQSAAAALGGPAALRAVGAAMPLDDGADPYVDALLDLGSPSELYGAVEELAPLFMPAAGLAVEVTGATSCRVRMSLLRGIEPFPELCALLAGLLSLLPRPFGCETATVEHQACRCDGASECVFEVSWTELGSPAAVVGMVRARSRAQRVRLDGLLETLGSVAGGLGIEHALERLVDSARRATHGTGIVLSLVPGAPSSTRVFSSGLDPGRARAVADQLVGDAESFAGPVVPVTGGGRHFGHLAVVPSMGVVTTGQLEVAEAYAQVAGAALQSTASENGVGRTGQSTVRLLELSARLADAASVDDAAATIADSLPGLIDCDHAVVVVRDRLLPIGRLAAVRGFTPEATDRLLRLVVSMFEVHEPGPLLREAAATPQGELDRCMVLGGSTAWLSLPLVADEELVGVLVAGVSVRPERLQQAGASDVSVDLARLAAVALRSAATLDDLRHDALHDPLTGVGNRALFLDHLALALERMRRSGSGGVLLLCDVDGFGALNERIGRGAADIVLRGVAARMAGALRRCDAPCRIGADAFAALLETSASLSTTAPAERVLAAVRQPLVVEPGEAPVVITASIGLLRVDATGDPDPEQLLAGALAAQATARAAGGDRVSGRY